MTEEEKAERRERKRIQKAKQRAANPELHRAANRRYKERHEDRVRKQQKNNYLANREARLAYAREWDRKQRENPATSDQYRESTRERMKKWRAENREHAREKNRLSSRLFRQENKEKCAAWNRRWRANNLEKSNEINRLSTERFRRSNPARYLWHCAKQRAKKFGLPFNLTVADITVPDICPALGVPMAQRTGPHSMTLDRVRPSLGYVKGNVAVICRRANLMKNDATSPEQLRKVADWLEAQLTDDGV